MGISGPTLVTHEQGGDAIAVEGKDGGQVKGQTAAGATPAQAVHIADPSGGATVDAEARTAINAILVALEGVGITADA
jgi:hypothetical protein